MQQVSGAWKESFNKQLVDETDVEISFTIADPDAVNDASASSNGNAYISKTAQITGDTDREITRCGTLERNLWLLDGSCKTAEVDKHYTGYMGDTLSLSDGTFDNNPLIRINFSAVHTPTIPGLTVTWSTAFGEYARDFQIRVYNGQNIIAQKAIYDNLKTVNMIEMDIENYDRIEIEIIKWCLPLHRARIEKILMGAKVIYTKSDITAYSHEQSADPIVSSIPMNKISFSLDNTDEKFSIGNDSGISKYLMERQKINVRYVLKVEGQPEYIPGGVFYLSEWKAPRNGLEASFTARDAFELLDGTYIKGVYYPDAISLYALAEDVLNDSSPGIEWELDDILKSYSTKAPLPVCTHAECLQYIASAAACFMYCDRKGVLRIEPKKNYEPSADYRIGRDILYEYPEISLLKPLKNILAKQYIYLYSDTQQELYNERFSVQGETELILNYSEAAVNVQAEVTNGTLLSAEYYSYACVLRVSANGYVTVTVKGNPLKASELNFTSTEPDSSDGVTQEIVNPLVTSAGTARRITLEALSYLEQRKQVSIGNFRADPRLDVGDVILCENKYSTDYLRITSLKYNYTGVFKGECEGMSMND